LEELALYILIKNSDIINPAIGWKASIILILFVLGNITTLMEYKFA